MNIFERFDNWLAKRCAEFKRRERLKYTKILEQMVWSRGVDASLFTCTLAHSINKQYGLWYRDRLEKHFRELGQSHSLTPFHKFVGYGLKRWERDEVIYRLRLQYINQLIEELDCPPTL